jgi:amino acid transporter
LTRSGSKWVNRATATEISPSTGIFALFFLGLTTVGGIFIWSWPIVAIGQLLVALGFAELSSHYPSRAPCSSGPLPVALIPAFNNMGWNLASTPHNQRWIAVITLIAITVMNIFGVRFVAIVNNTGVLFEILGMVVFAFVVALFHHHQSAGVIFHSGGTNLALGTFLVAMFMSLYVIYGFDTASTLAEETRSPRTEAPKAVIASTIRLCFGLSRDGALPGSRVLAKVHSRLHTPIGSSRSACSPGSR